MEILSTGEKIKRARIFKGITLKELCDTKISIAKMSCVENGKIKADKELLQYVAEKMDIDIDYLLEDVFDQLTNNLDNLRKNASCDAEAEEKLQNNIDYSIKYGYYNLGFEFMHILFLYYIEQNKMEKIQLIVSQYYDLFQRNNTEENTIIYFKDMAQYFSNNNEYIEAISYYGKLREIIVQRESYNKSEYCMIGYNEALCYLKLSKYEEAYTILAEIIDYVDTIELLENRGMIYHIYACVCIKLKKENEVLYKEKAYEYQKHNPISLAVAKGNYGKYYFEISNKEMAIKEIEEGIELFPKDNNEKQVEFLNYCIEILIDNEEYDKAYNIAENALNMAIISGNIKLVEKSYYLKGSILQKKGRYKEAEKYMTLSLDSLFKFGSRQERKSRYMDMAKLYYELGDTIDSLKYFNLSFAVDKKI